jgi:hypothetical protein
MCALSSLSVPPVSTLVPSLTTITCARYMATYYTKDE